MMSRLNERSPALPAILKAPGWICSAEGSFFFLGHFKSHYVELSGAKSKLTGSIFWDEKMFQNGIVQFCAKPRIFFGFGFLSNQTARVCLG